tara:strand:+ start:320 stop:1063 length:744 start_codon:yes stop_codon:yes gene_type:complete
MKIIFCIIILSLLIILFYNNNNNIKIPKIIHQSYKSYDIKDKLWLECQQSWKDLNKDYKYKFWTDDDNLNLIKNKDKQFVDKFLSYNHFIKRADASRYYYLYHYGGIYADLDFKCLKPFDSLLKKYNNYDIILGRMGHDKNMGHSIPNALMISKPNCDFWLHVIKEMKKRVNKASPEYDTGPVLLKNCVDSYKGSNKIKILDTTYFYPINWTKNVDQKERSNIIRSKNINNNKFKKSYAMTYWSHSW